MSIENTTIFRNWPVLCDFFYDKRRYNRPKGAASCSRNTANDAHSSFASVQIGRAVKETRDILDIPEVVDSARFILFLSRHDNDLGIFFFLLGPSNNSSTSILSIRSIRSITNRFGIDSAISEKCSPVRITDLI